MMNNYWIWYIFNTILSTFLSFLAIYLIVYQSPREMKAFRWILLNIQISAYVETVFWALFFAPTFELFPLIMLTPIGIATTWFGIPGQALSIVLHGVIDGSLAIGLFYRYYIILPLMSIRPHWIFFAIPPAMQYLVGGGGCGLCSLYSFLDPEVTRGIFLEKSLNGSFPDGGMTFGGPGLIPWAGILIFAIFAVGICLTFILTHSVLIMERSSASMRNKNMHKSALRSLLLQLSATFSCSVVPMIVFSYQLLQEPTDTQSNSHLQWLTPICLAYFSMKAINCSLAGILTTTPYRLYLFTKIGLIKKDSNVFMIQPSTTAAGRPISITPRLSPRPR